jgi:peptidoglycan/xylan/chitin deacetylase (PgdA/CDA1 family)
MAIRHRAPGARVPAAVTFDDDLSSHVSEALPVLQRAKVPAAFFLCGASLTGPHRFWWERLDAALTTRGAEEALSVVEIEAPTIHEQGRQVEELPPSRRDQLSDRLRELNGPDPPDAGLRACQVQAIADAGFEVGFHTIRHDALTTLDDRQLAAAMSNGRAPLERLVGAIESFAYPHGRVDVRAIEAVRAAGFGNAFTTTGEAITGEDDPLALSRVEAPLHSVGELAYAVASALRRALRARRSL